jgi:glycosyltransferase involved in cell wall biosynthesis
MRILHVDTASGWRGGQNQVLLAAVGMARLGHEVALACRHGGALETRARAAGLNVHALAFGGDLKPAGLLGLFRLVRRLRPDVLQLHDPHAISAGVLATRGRARALLVATRRVDFPLKGWPSRLKYRACRRVVATSAAIRSVLERDGLDPVSLRLVYEGVPDRAPQPGGREALAALGVPLSAPIVGNVAALSDHKDQRTLLLAAPEVLRRVPAAHFVIVGDGELRSALERLAGELGLAGRCTFAGFRDDLDRLIPVFDVFCLSSHLEGLGTSLLDAMCFARAIVATAAGGIPEAVEDGETGRVVPVRDPQALAAALGDVLCDGARQRAYGAAGRRRFERLFTAERMVSESLRVFEEAA